MRATFLWLADDAASAELVRDPSISIARPVCNHVLDRARNAMSLCRRSSAFWLEGTLVVSAASQAYDAASFSDGETALLFGEPWTILPLNAASAAAAWGRARDRQRLLPHRIQRGVHRQRLWIDFDMQ